MSDDEPVTMELHQAREIEAAAVERINAELRLCAIQGINVPKEAVTGARQAAQATLFSERLIDTLIGPVGSAERLRFDAVVLDRVTKQLAETREQVAAQAAMPQPRPGGLYVP